MLLSKLAIVDEQRCVKPTHKTSCSKHHRRSFSCVAMKEHSALYITSLPSFLNLSMLVFLRRSPFVVVPTELTRQPLFNMVYLTQIVQRDLVLDNNQRRTREAVKTTEVFSEADSPQARLAGLVSSGKLLQAPASSSRSCQFY